MAVTRSVAVRNAEADAGMGGTNFDRLSLYTGAPPGATAAQTGTLLATFLLNATAFAAAANGTISTNAIADVTAVAGGTVGAYLFWKSTQTNANTAAPAAADRRAQGTVTATGGGGDLTVDNPTLVSGQTVHANTLSFTMPA